MRTLKLITLCCLLLAFSSCKKSSGPKLSTDFSIEITDITAVNARLAIDAIGDNPSLIRYMAPIPEDHVKSEVNMTNESAMKSFISKNGSAIQLPYSAILQDLAPETTYVVGVIAIDAQMNIYSYKTASFTMKDLASQFENTLGNPSNAGDLTENTLQDKK